MFQAILNIDYLILFELWESEGPGMHNFKWYKIAELSEVSGKNIIYALRHGDHTFNKHISQPLGSFIYI